MPYATIGSVTVWAPDKKKKQKRQYKPPQTDADREKSSKFQRDDWDPRFGEWGKDDTSGHSTLAWRLVSPKHKELENYVKITRVSSEKSTRLPTHPLETGMVKHDHKIVEPRKITVDCYIEATDGISKKCSSILSAMVEEKSLDDYLMVENPMDGFTTKVENKEVPSKLYIVNYKDTTERDKTDVFTFTLTLQELLRATNKNIVSGNPDYAGTTAKGGQGQGTKA